MRIGHGFDVHAFTEGDHIVLGGVRIPHKYTFEAHSDGDVLLHALCDAFLGAISAGDIGRHFPDDDPKYKNIDSCILLKNVYEKVLAAGYLLENADITVIAQAPKLQNHIDEMCEKIASQLDVDKNLINVKATTTEGLGFTGREEGIAVNAIVLLKLSEK